MSKDLHKFLSDVRRQPIDVTLEQSLVRAELLQSRRRRARRIMVVASLLLLTSLGLYLALRNSAPASTSLSLTKINDSREKGTSHEPGPLPPFVSLPTAGARKPKGIDRMIPKNAPSLSSVVFDHEDLQVRLPIDGRAIETIVAMVAPGDRVVAVDDLGGRETCINVSCAGGDVRSIVCTAPAPSPVRVTTTDGTLLYDIDRIGTTTNAGPYVAIRTRIPRGEVLLWYRVEDNLRGVMPAPLLETTATVDAVHGMLQQDSTVVIERSTGSSPWRRVSVLTPSGRSAPVRAQWVDHRQGSTQLRIQSSGAATYEVRVARFDGSEDHFLLVLR